MNKRDAEEAIGCYATIKRCDSFLETIESLRKGGVLSISFTNYGRYGSETVLKNSFTHGHQVSKLVLDYLEADTIQQRDAEFRRLAQLGFEKP